MDAIQQAALARQGRQGDGGEDAALAALDAKHGFGAGEPAQPSQDAPIYRMNAPLQQQPARAGMVLDDGPQPGYLPVSQQPLPLHPAFPNAQVMPQSQPQLVEQKPMERGQFIAPNQPTYAEQVPTQPQPATTAFQQPPQVPAQQPVVPQQDPAQQQLFERAMIALKRDGVPDQVIQTTPRADMIAWGAAAFERQSKADDSFRRVNERAQAVTNGQPENQTGTPEGTPEMASLDDVFGPLAEAFGDEGGDAIKKAIQTLDSRHRSALTARDKQLEDARKTIETLNGNVLAMQADVVRRELAPAVPALQNEDAWQQVVGKAVELAQGGYPFSDMRALLNTSVDVLFGAHARQQLAAQHTQEAAARDEGQPQQGYGVQSEQPETLYYEDLEDRVLDALEAGNKPLAGQAAEAMKTAPSRLADSGRLYFRR